MKVKPIRPSIRLDVDEESLPASQDDIAAQPDGRNMEAGSEIDNTNPDEESEDTYPARTLLFGDENDSDEYCEASLLTSPHIGATFAIADLYRDSELGSPNDLTTLSILLKVQSNSKGDGIDALKLQTKTLDAMFYRLISSAMSSDQPDVQEAFLKLALKAQSQSRATLQTISDIRQPKIANVVKQANIAGGHQQVNNGDCSQPARTKENKSPPNELTEE